MANQSILKAFERIWEHTVSAIDEVKEYTDAALNNQKGSANGIASLDENGKVPSEQLPETTTLETLGVTATADELNYMDGVTSNVQTQLNAKQATITGGATTIASSDLTADRALISDGSGKVAISEVTSTELGYLDGVTSAIQTQLNAKAPAYTYGTTDLTAGSSALASGTLYFVYE